MGYIMHYGSIIGGHYTSINRNLYDNKWYNYNDDYVGEVNL